MKTHKNDIKLVNNVDVFVILEGMSKKITNNKNAIINKKLHLPLLYREVWQFHESGAHFRCIKLPFAAASQCSGLASAASAPPPTVEPSYFVSVMRRKCYLQN